MLTLTFLKISLPFNEDENSADFRVFGFQKVYSSCSSLFPHSPAIQIPEGGQILRMNIAEAEVDFGFRLLREAAPSESFVFSPISVSILLALTSELYGNNIKDEIRSALLPGA